jgi:hypothetical protein
MSIGLPHAKLDRLAEIANTGAKMSCSPKPKPKPKPGKPKK